MAFTASTGHNGAIRAAVVITIGCLSVLGLAGCTGKNSTGTTPTKTAPSHSGQATPDSMGQASDATPSASATPTPGPSVEPPRATGTPIGVNCNGLVSPQAIYDYNPNFSLVPGFTPKSGTHASKALGLRGLACQWINQTSSDTITIAVAHPATADLAALKTAARGGTAVSGIGDAAWFTVSGGVGELQVFRGPFWITASSVYFGTADDARELASVAAASAK